MHKILETEIFRKRFNKLIPKNSIEYIQKAIRKLENNPYNQGKPLGYRFVRELKFKKFRIYYLIYDKYLIVLLITVSNKKNQQETINLIKKNLSEYLKSVKNISYNELGGEIDEKRRIN